MRGHVAAVGIGVLAAVLAGCGGGGGSTPSIPPGSSPTAPSSQLNLPPAGTDNTESTYTVYQLSGLGTTQVGIAPIGSGPPTQDPGWTVVTGGAEVFYPDGTLQLTDALGNFDAAQSSWALANQGSLAANPNDNPEVFIAIPFVSPQVPLDTTVVAYAPNSGTQTASVERDAAGLRRRDGSGATVAELASVTLFPRGIAMFDNEVRTFTLVGTDTDGDYVNLNGATVHWTLGGCAGSSGGSAGQITQSSKDAARAVYKPPSSGTFSSPDLVTATVTANGTTYCAASNAYYYDLSSGVSISGILDNASSQPQANGIVSFYGGGRLFYAGNLVAVTDSNGKFARLLPPNRTLTLVGGNAPVSGGRPATATWYTLTPSQATAGGPGTTIASATYTEAGTFQNPFKPLPPIDRAIRDGYELGAVTIQNFPFNRPNASGQFKTCSIDAIINNVAGSTACTSVTATGDAFKGWAVTNIANNGTNVAWIFQEPANEEGGRHVIQIESTASVTIPSGISDGNTAGLATCTAQVPCWNEQEFYNPIGLSSSITSLIASNNGTLSGAPAGTILASDGGFNENVGASGAFQVYMLRNEYSVGHQVQGEPLYTHTVGFNYASAGATTAAVNDSWYNGAGLSEGSLSMTRTPDSGDPGFTVSATGTRNYYKGSTIAATIGYSIAGSYNTPGNPHAGTLTVTVTSDSADANLVNASAVYAYQPGGTSTCGAGYPTPINGLARICGQIIDPNVPNLANNLGTNVVADFTADSTLYVDVVVDQNLGAQPESFHL